MTTLRWSWRGTTNYGPAVELQEELRRSVLAGHSSGHLVLLEHNPVITLGRHADRRNILGSADALEAARVEVAVSSRGGDVTYHGPGQLMVYPVVNVGRRVRAHVEAVARALGEVAGHFGVKGAMWKSDPPGLWWRDRKLAACGLHIHRGVAIHGFALNVATPRDSWQWIVPCGLTAATPVSIGQARAEQGAVGAPTVEQVADIAGPIICRTLGFEPHQER